MDGSPTDMRKRIKALLTTHGLLLIIFLIGTIIRLWQLGEIPVGLHGDEASIGYSAYSLLKTGKDETGAKWPLAVNQFGDYRPAGYYYLDIPFIAAFGLTELAVRLPSAIFGSLYLLVFYALVQELFKKKSVSILSTFLLSISPWHIIISRATSEGIVSSFLILLGTTVFLKAFRNRISKTLIFVSLCCFLTSFFFYHSARIFVPVFFPLLVVFSLFRSGKSLKQTIPFALIYAVLLAGVAFFLTSGGGTHRAMQVAVFSVPGNQNTLTQQIAEEFPTQPVLITRFFHNKLVLNLRMFLTFYFQHFAGEFLFMTTGKPIRYAVPWSGNLYLIELPFLLFGLSVLFSDGVREKKIHYFFPLLFLLIGAIPAGLTWEDTPNIQRASLMIPAIYIAIAVGMEELYGVIKRARWKWILVAVIGVLFFQNAATFLHTYFHHLKTHEPWNRSAAVKELVRLLPTVSGQYKKVIMTSDGNNNFILYLFHNRIDPVTFLASGAPREHNGLMVGNIEYVGNPCPLGGNTTTFLNEDPRVLYINSYSCKDPENAEIVRIIRHPDTSGAYKLIKIDPDYLKKKTAAQNAASVKK